MTRARATPAPAPAAAASTIPAAPAAGGPTPAEQFFFESYGYVVLPDFLAAGHVAALLAALERAVARRRTPTCRREHPTAFADQLAGRNARIFHLLDEDPLFLELMDHAPAMGYVRALLNRRPHFHASDGIDEVEPGGQHGVGWHRDGIDGGYRQLGWPIPLLQLKIGYYLSDMSEPDQGNLAVVPGSHRAAAEPDAADLRRPELFDGAVQICGRPGTAVMFHNALWHSAGPFTRRGGRRAILYYGYEHPWMLAAAETWRYPQAFLNSLPPAKRALMHGFLFEPREYRTL